MDSILDKKKYPEPKDAADWFESDNGVAVQQEVLRDIEQNTKRLTLLQQKAKKERGKFFFHLP